MGILRHNHRLQCSTWGILEKTTHQHKSLWGSFDKSLLGTINLLLSSYLQMEVNFGWFFNGNSMASSGIIYHVFTRILKPKVPILIGLFAFIRTSETNSWIAPLFPLYSAITSKTSPNTLLCVSSIPI